MCYNDNGIGERVKWDKNFNLKIWVDAFELETWKTLTFVKQYVILFKSRRSDEYKPNGT